MNQNSPLHRVARVCAVGFALTVLTSLVYAGCARDGAQQNTTPENTNPTPDAPNKNDPGAPAPSPTIDPMALPATKAGAFFPPQAPQQQAAPQQAAPHK